MAATERLLTEKNFHDCQALERASTFSRHPEQLRFDDDAYLDHETWIRPAFQRLGKVQGKRVLDLGCGHGMASVVLARSGARVTALDLSSGYLREAKARAQANDVPVAFVQANAEQLPFEDASFDAVWGMAVLHHLNVDHGVRELHRVLRPGGVAICSEPMGENPLLNLARENAAYPGKNRTPDEEPLRRRHLKAIRRVFPMMEMQGYQLLSMVPRTLGKSGFQGLAWCDEMLLKRVPVLRLWCRYVVLTLPRT